MLMLFNAFFNRISVKSIPYLLNPRIVNENEVFFFKGMILHYLNIDTNEMFITRDSRYFKDIPENKKIIIYHLEDFIFKEDTISLKNKHLKRDIKKWNMSNLKQFRYFNFIENGISDENTIHVINYNTIKDLYNYKSSMLSEYNQFNNLYRTVTEYIKICLDKFKNNKQILNVKIPLAIPSYFIIDRLISFNDIKYTRIVKDIHLKLIIEIYKWLSNKTRERSIFSNITDEESNNLILEFEYKNHFVYVTLGLLRSLSNESKLESRLKLEPSKLNRLFIFILLRIQKQIDGEEVLDKNMDEDKKDEKLLHHEMEIEEEKEEENLSDTYSDVSPDEIQDNIIQSIDKKENIKKFKEIKNLQDKNIVLIEDEENINSLMKKIDKDLIENEDVDNIFIEDILKEKDNLNIEDEESKERKFTIETDEEALQQLLFDTSKEKKFEAFLERNKDFKLLSSSDIRNLKKLQEQRKLLKSPYEKTANYDDFIKIDVKQKEITEEDKKIDVKNDIIDEELKYENINTMHKKYIRELMQKDIISCIAKLEDSEIIIKDHKVEEEKTLQGNYEIHSLTLKPYLGKESTIYLRLPKIDSDGRFYASGVKMLLRKQKADLPIRKISPTRVSLISNYCKLFISRTERKAFNYYNFLVENIKKDFLSEKQYVKKLQPENSFDNYLNLPPLLMYFSKHFNNIELQEYKIECNYKEAKNRLNEETLKSFENKGYYYFGYKKSTKEPILIDFNENIYLYTKNQFEQIESIEQLLGIDQEKIPVDFSTLKLLGKEIPLGIILSYYLGLSNLIGLLKADVTFIESNKRYTPTNKEFIVKFKNYKMIVNKTNKEASLLLSGFLFFKDFIKNYNIEDFNEKNIYLPLLEFRDYNMLHVKELDLLRDLFLDPITVDVLKDIQEPHEYIPLLLRANQLLTNFDHPDKNDANYFRIRGYERIPGLMYKALVESVRNYKFKYNSKGKIELDPYKVWNNITQDNTSKIVEDVNPVMDLKEIEAVTFTGQDGIDREAFPLELRKYHKNDIGLTSEATVDNADVGLSAYLSPNAKIKNLRGIIDSSKTIQNKHEIFSTSTNLSPFALHDDPKRINFINIQNSHTIATKGYVQPAIRTEYEYLIPYRSSKMFSFVAEDDGIVLDVTDKQLKIKYKNGTEKSLVIGKVYGKAEGTVYEHILVSNVNKNDKFKKNDILYYNSNFFEKDWVSNSLILKMNKLYTVALVMTNEVFEDSSAVSKKLSEEMSTRITKEYSFIIEFSKNIINIIPEGSQVEPDTPLFTILEEETDLKNINEAALSILSNFVNFSPKAKVRGTLERYEVRYNGDISDMSFTLKKFVSKIEKEMIERYRGTEYEIKSCKVNHEYRVEGKNLLADTLELKAFISFDVSAAIGDKGVFSTQLKSVISDVFTNKVIAEQSKDEIDAFFSYNSIANRITLSPLITGILNRILRLEGKRIAEEYFK